MTYCLTADLDEARDITQEAFCRAWTRWQHVSGYDNPITWVRRVAANLAYSRWRHLRAATAHLLRHKTDEAVAAPPNLDHVILVAGLRRLPRHQCIALVLHHMLDLPVTQIAEVLEVPVGRVKVWLHRGRRILAAELGRDFNTPALNGTPPVGPTIQHGKDRQRTRKTAAKAAAFLLTLLAATTATSPVQLTRPGPAPSTRPVVIPMAATDVTATWEGDRLIVRWTDPSDGYAQPILIGARANEGLRRLGAPVKGDTLYALSGFNRADTICVAIVLVYTGDILKQSEQVCAEPSSPTR